ncbi:MAG TPA: hypothetical protein VKH42_21740 [Vicinamibacterales bacterium]|nr:hypothetical protein [Vicinamibacterales bacterium]
MPWTCPACQNAIQHSPAEATPSVGVTYRCPICRLELIVDPDRGKMTLAPMRADDDGDSKVTAGPSKRKAADRDRR